MANDPKLNIAITSDTSGINKGSAEAKKAIRDLSKSSESALSGIGDALGVNTAKIEQMGNAFKGLGLKMTQSSKEGVAAMGKLIASTGKLAMGLAGLGVGAAALAFKELNSQADAFKQTVAGANIEMATAAYIATYKQVFYDLNAAQGKSFAEFMAKAKETAAAVGAVFGRVITTPDAVRAGSGFWKDTAKDIQDANEKARTAAEYAKQIYALERQRSDKAVEYSQTEAEIANLKTIIWDKTNSEADRQAALAKVQDLIRQKYTEQYSIESGIADLMEATNLLSNSTLAQIDAANQQRIKANNLVAQMDTELKSLLRQQNSLNTSSAADAAARAKSVAEAKELQRVLSENRAMLDTAVQVKGLDAVTGIPSEQEVSLKPDTSALDGLKTTVTADVQLATAAVKGLKTTVTADVQLATAAVKGLEMDVKPVIVDNPALKGALDGLDVLVKPKFEKDPFTGLDKVVEMPVDLIARPEAVSEFKTLASAELGDMSIEIRKITAGPALAAAIEEANAMMSRALETAFTDMAVTVAESMGELVADLATGENAMQNFGQNMLSSLGDMAMSIGKIAIQTGMTMIGIKASLANPYTAIAAGALLVALGAAAKKSAQNVLNSGGAGSYSASSSVASSSSYRSGAMDYDTREMTVKVTGKLYASGSELVAALNSEDNRKSHTT